MFGVATLRAGRNSHGARDVNILLSRITGRATSALLFNAVALLTAVCIFGLRASCAQTASSRPTIFVAAEVHAKASLPAPMPVLIGPPKSIPQGVLFLIRGLPAGTSFSEGQPLSDTTWTVPLADTPRLKITPAADSAGAAEFNLVLATYEGVILAQAKVRLIVDPPSSRGAKPQKAASAGPPDPSLSIAASPDETKLAIPQDDKERAQMLMQKGDEYLRSGKIAAARLFYQRAAESGWAPAALALGGSYDADELLRLNVVGGVQPNAGEAKKWYEKAKVLGAPEAGPRLARLGQR